MSIGARIAAGVGFDAALGQITERLDKISAQLEISGKRGDKNPVQTPLVRKFAASKVAANVTYNFIDCGGPARGRIWDLRRLAVYGPDPFTAVTGNVFVFIGSVQPFDSSTEPANFPEIVGDLATTTIPYRDSWPRGTATLLPQERVFVGLKSVPNATVLWVYGQAVEWWENDADSWGAL
jgi:hypothetical protein